MLPYNCGDTYIYDTDSWLLAQVVRLKRKLDKGNIDPISNWCLYVMEAERQWRKLELEAFGDRVQLQPKSGTCRCCGLPAGSGYCPKGWDKNNVVP
jgi:hypothetical protein